MEKYIYGFLGAVIITLLLYIDNKISSEKKTKSHYLRVFSISLLVIVCSYYMMTKKDELSSLLGGGKIDIDNIDVNLPNF